MKKILFLLFLSLLAVPTAFAGVFITEVMYDPETSEFDTEFVEIYNQGNQDIDISGWMIYTISLQATLPDNTIIKANTSLLIADQDDGGYWPADWAEPDYSDEEITLSNSDSGVQLLDSEGNIVDVVGWGSAPAGLYEGTPHQGVSSGMSLSRIRENNSFIDTNNNSKDFIASLPNPRNSKQKSETGFEINLFATVSGNQPIIEIINISPDEFPEQGVQILPVPGSSKQVLFTAILTDHDGYDDIQSTSLMLELGEVQLDFNYEINNTSASYSGYFNMSYYYNASNYSVGLLVKDSSNLSATSNTSFEYLGVAAFEVDTVSIEFNGTSGYYSEVLGDVDMHTTQNPTIRNIGNVALDFLISGTDLTSDFDTISTNNLEYTFLDNDYNDPSAGVLSTQPKTIELNLAPGEFTLRELTTRLYIPTGTPTGVYSGKMSLVGVAS